MERALSKRRRALPKENDLSVAAIARFRAVSTWQNKPKPEIRQNKPNVGRLNSIFKSSWDRGSFPSISAVSGDRPDAICPLWPSQNPVLLPLPRRKGQPGQPQRPRPPKSSESRLGRHPEAPDIGGEIGTGMQIVLRAPGETLRSEDAEREAVPVASDGKR